jgi:hypothetical protein
MNVASIAATASNNLDARRMLDRDPADGRLIRLLHFITRTTSRVLSRPGMPGPLVDLRMSWRDLRRGSIDHAPI